MATPWNKVREALGIASRGTDGFTPWTGKGLLESFGHVDGLTTENADAVAKIVHKVHSNGLVSAEALSDIIYALEPNKAAKPGAGQSVMDMMRKSSDPTERFFTRAEGSDMGPRPGIFGRTVEETAKMYEDMGYEGAAANLRNYMEGSELRTPQAHGTRGNFDEFRVSKDIGTHTGNIDQAHDISSNSSEFQGSSVMPVWVRGKKFFEMPDLGGWHPVRIVEQLEASGELPPVVIKRIQNELNARPMGQRGTKDMHDIIAKNLQKEGYDGIKYRNVGEGKAARGVREGTGTGRFGGGDKEFSYITFDPKNIKSATGNRGTFSAAEADIRHSMFAPVGMPSRHPDAGAFEGRSTGAEGDLLTTEERGNKGIDDFSKAMNPITQIKDAAHAIKEGVSNFDWSNPLGRANAGNTANVGLGLLGMAGSLADVGAAVKPFRGALKLEGLADNLAEHTGGFTYDPRTGKMITEGGSVVANPKGASSMVLDGIPTPAQLQEFAKKNAKLLKTEGHTIGGWQDGDTGKFYLEVSSVHPHDEAVKIAKERGEKAVWNLDDMKQVDTGDVAAVGDATTWPTTKDLLAAGDKRKGNIGAAALKTSEKWKPTERGVIDRSIPAGYLSEPLPFTTKASPRAKPTAIAEQLATDPRVEARLESDLQKGFNLGGEEWYAPGPLRSAVEEHGGNFDDFTNAGGAGSIRTPTHNELTNASLLMYAKKHGITPEEAVQIFKKKFPGINPYFMPGTMGSVFQRAETAGGLMVPPSPTSGGLKVPNYVAARRGYGRGLALDTHEARAAAQATGLSEEAILGATKSASDYHLREQPYLRLAEKYGIHPSQVQAGRWIGGGTQTGLHSQPVGDLSQTIEDGLLYTNRLQGLDESPIGLRKTFADIVQGNGFFLPTSNRGGFPVY